MEQSRCPSSLHCFGSFIYVISSMHMPFSILSFIIYCNTFHHQSNVSDDIIINKPKVKYTKRKNTSIFYFSTTVFTNVTKLKVFCKKQQQPIAKPTKILWMPLWWEADDISRLWVIYKCWQEMILSHTHISTPDIPCSLVHVTFLLVWYNKDILSKT